MTINSKIKDEKLQCAINREAAKISALSSLSSGKIDMYEYLTGEEILPSNQKQMIELRWCSARDLFGSQIPVTTGRFEL